MIRLSKITGLKPFQQEKAYAQTLILKLLYSETTDPVFKGGTELAMFAHLPRFSEDLDFNVNKNIKILSIIKKISAGLDLIGLKNSYKLNKINNVSNSYQFSIEGPLFTTPVSRITVKIDLSMREKLIMPTEVKTFNPLYSDIMPFDAVCMNINEIMDEKVRAIITRNKARDVFDLYYMLKNYKIILDKNIINNKLSYYGLTFSYEKFQESIEKKRNIWKIELDPVLLIKTPDFDETKNFILREIV